MYLWAGVGPIIFVEMIATFLDLFEQPLLIFVVKRRVPRQEHIAYDAHTVDFVKQYKVKFVSDRKIWQT